MKRSDQMFYQMFYQSRWMKHLAECWHLKPNPLGCLPVSFVGRVQPQFSPCSWLSLVSLPAASKLGPFLSHQHCCSADPHIWVISDSNSVESLISLVSGYMSFIFVTIKLHGQLARTEVKGISRQKIYFASNLIFWVGMGWGIGHFSQRGLARYPVLPCEVPGDPGTNWFGWGWGLAEDPFKI